MVNILISHARELIVKGMENFEYFKKMWNFKFFAAFEATKKF